MGLLAIKEDQLAARLAGLTLPAGMPEARAAALGRLRSMGLPESSEPEAATTDPSASAPEGSASAAEGAGTAEEPAEDDPMKALEDAMKKDAQKK